VAKPIEEGLAEQERDELRAQIIQGCQDMSGLYQEIEQEWSRTSDEIWPEFD